VENFEMPENEEVKFLEDNFDQLNRTHKKTLSSLNDAQRDLVKYQTMLECKSRRVNELEVILKDTKEAADREYRKLRDENESMKNNFMAKLKERERLSYMRKKGPTIGPCNVCHIIVRFWFSSSCGTSSGGGVEGWG
jgi:chromosome segregation ATPase